jgi:hypothetical protein
MLTRRLVSLLMAVMTLVVLAPQRGAALLDHEGLDPLPVRGSVLPTGNFVGTLRIVACTLDAAGQLRLTGVLSGTATHHPGARILVPEQPFTVLATLRDPGHTTDVVRLALAPIALDPGGVRITLAPITVDLYALPDVGDELATLLNQEEGTSATPGQGSRPDDG